MSTPTVDRMTSIELAAKVQIKTNGCFHNSYVSLPYLPHHAKLIVGDARFRHAWLLLDNKIIDPTYANDSSPAYEALQEYTHAELEKLKQEGRIQVVAGNHFFPEMFDISARQ
jgi:hypothetical protein